MIEENNKVYLEKELFFDRTRIIDQLIKENDKKKMYFFSNIEDKFMRWN